MLEHIIMDDIQTLWQQHRAAGFPSACCGVEIEGTDLVLLDADTAGCVQTFLARDGELDLWRVATLALCYRELAIVVRVLQGEGRDYFARLENLSRLVLRAVADRPRKT